MFPFLIYRVKTSTIFNLSGNILKYKDRFIIMLNVGVRAMLIAMGNLEDYRWGPELVLGFDFLLFSIFSYFLLLSINTEMSKFNKLKYMWFFPSIGLYYDIWLRKPAKHLINQAESFLSKSCLESYFREKTIYTHQVNTVINFFSYLDLQ